MLSELFESALGIRCILSAYNLIGNHDSGFTNADLKIILVYLGIQTFNKYIIHNDDYDNLKNKFYLN
jgi:hypothetical protein